MFRIAHPGYPGPGRHACPSGLPGGPAGCLGGAPDYHEHGALASVAGVYGADSVVGAWRSLSEKVKQIYYSKDHCRLRIKRDACIS